ncbi:MAG: hypothetical protein ABI256_11120 [Rhodoferax sp.]
MKLQASLTVLVRSHSLSTGAAPLVKTLLLSTLVVFTLSGCGVDKMIRDDDMKENRSKCVDYGFRPGSDEFANCMERSMENTEQERERSYRDYKRREDAREAREKK